MWKRWWCRLQSLLSSAADLLVTNNSGDREQCPTSTERSYSDADPHPQSEHSPRSSLQYSACVNDPLLAPKIPSFLCPECGKSFEKNFLLNTHLDATHPDSVHLICTVMYCIVQVSTTLFVLNLWVQLRHFSRPTQKLSTWVKCKLVLMMQHFLDRTWKVRKTT